MSRKNIQIDDRLQAYLHAHTLREPPLWAELRAETAPLPQANMQIGPELGQFISWLVELIGARNALEIGVFTGYSALCIARALPEGGRLTACDVSAEWTQTARRYWQAAGLSDRIELQLRPALESLRQLEESGAAGSFDFVFIDADKTNHQSYYEHALRLLRDGGVVMLDNALWDGKVAEHNPADPDSAALRALNAHVRDDPRVSMSLLPFADGVLLARKRAR